MIEESIVNDKQKIYDINLEDYEKEEGSGFYYKKNILFKDSDYKLVGVGCRYKVLLSIYSVGIYINNIPNNLQIENSVNRILNDESKKMGCYYVLSALTLVSVSAAEALPWLYEAVAYH